MNNMEPPFPADPDPIPEAYLRGPSIRDELLYLARLNVATLSVCAALYQAIALFICG